MTSIPSTTTHNTLTLVVTWQMVGAVVGTIATIGLGSIGLGVTAFLHLDAQIHQQIESVRTDIRAVRTEIQAVEARIDGLYRPPAPNMGVPTETP